MKLSKKQKQFLYDLLAKTYMPSACDGAMSDYLEGTDKKQNWQDFKDSYGITINQAIKWWDHFIEELGKSI